MESPWKIEMADGRHGELEDRLVEGELDAAFIPASAAQKWGKKITPLGGWGLTSAGVTETALLIAPRRIDLIDGEEVAISPAEEGTAADQLLRALVTPYYGITLKLVTEGEEGYDRAASRLMFGDGAVREGEIAKSKGQVAEDIGLAWWVLTGLPMVWEVLCAPRSLEDRKPGASTALQNVLKVSQRAAVEQMGTVVEATAASVGLSVERVKELFARQSYSLGANEQKGLAQFLDMVGRMEGKRG
jgi:predicted solute-binding protein